MNKKFILILSLIISTLMMSASFAKGTFSDINGSKYEEAVNRLVEMKVVNGMGDGTFRPNDDVTRAQLAKMIVVAFELKGSSKVNFLDFDASHWASDYIKTAVKNEIILGYTDNTFKPENKVTYAEAATMLLRAGGYENNKLKNGVWPDDYMKKAEQLEMFKDILNYASNKEANRGDIALMIYNLLRDNIEDEEIENEKVAEKSEESLRDPITIFDPQDENDNVKDDEKVAEKSEESLRDPVTIFEPQNKNDNKDNIKDDEKVAEKSEESLRDPVTIYEPQKNNTTSTLTTENKNTTTSTSTTANQNTTTSTTTNKNNTSTTSNSGNTIDIDTKGKEVISENKSGNLVTELGVVGNLESLKRKPDAEIPPQPKPKLEVM